MNADLRRYEGVRIKHHLGGNTVKAYDKAGSVLRIETTISQPKQFRVFRTTRGDPHGKKAWRPLRKSVADLHRRAASPTATSPLDCIRGLVRTKANVPAPPPASAIVSGCSAPHGLIRKVKGQRRYRITPKGRKIASALLVAQTTTLQQLNALAA